MEERIEAQEETLDSLIQEQRGANVLRGVISFIFTLVIGIIVVFKFFEVADDMGLTGDANDTYYSIKDTVYLVFGLLTVFLLAVGAGIVMSAV